MQEQDRAAHMLLLAIGTDHAVRLRSRINAALYLEAAVLQRFGAYNRRGLAPALSPNAGDSGRCLTILYLLGDECQSFL